MNTKLKVYTVMTRASAPIQGGAYSGFFVRAPTANAALRACLREGLRPVKINQSLYDYPSTDFTCTPWQDVKAFCKALGYTVQRINYGGKPEDRYRVFDQDGLCLGTQSYDATIAMLEEAWANKTLDT